MGRAFIFASEDTAAALEAANAFAGGINCAEYSGGPDAKGCGVCLSCRTFENGNNPDIFVVRGTNIKSIGADDVREQIIEPASIHPFKHKYKIFIIEKAELLTPQAQNVLLKTIEEPAPYGVYLFVAPSVYRFLPTILSRCTVIKLPSTKKAPAQDDLADLAYELLSKAERANIYDAFLLYKRFDGLEKEAIFTILDHICVLIGEKISKGQRDLYTAYDSVTRTSRILKQNGNQQLALELMLASMKKGV